MSWVNTVMASYQALALLYNDREWHRIYQQKRDAGLELPLAFDYPPNLDVNKQINQSWKAYIQRPTLLRDIAHLEPPALFIYGTNDIRPSWPVEQVVHLLPRGRLQLLGVPVITCGAMNLSDLASI